MTPVRLKEKKILVVEDDIVVSKILSSIFLANGYTTMIARDGPEAMTCVHLQRPDLILLDMFFPENALQGTLIWDGFLMMSWLNSLGGAGDIPVIVMSATTAEKYKNLSLGLRARAFFPKPLNTKRVLTAIHTIFDGSSMYESNFNTRRKSYENHKTYFGETAVSTRDNIHWQWVNRRKSL
jgi:CheY-like chemotaxis protein